MYKDVCGILQDGKCGDFKIDHFEVTKGNFRYALQGISPGRYVRLTKNGEVVMSDTDMEKRTNAEFIIRAHGDVIVGGLGIGLILLAIQDKEDVTSITVIEKNMEVISLVMPYLGPHLNKKVKVEYGDVFTWRPPKGRRYDCIYMDIWPFINRDVYEEEMVPLKRRYGHYLKPLSQSPNRFNMAWAEYNAKNEIRLV